MDYMVELEYDENGKLVPWFYIEVGLTFDSHTFRRRLNITEDQLQLDTIGFDIKNIMTQLKIKQKEILLKEFDLK